MLQHWIPGSPKISKDFDRKAYSNVLKIFDICLKLPSDSKKYFGFVIHKFSELVHGKKSRYLRHIELFAGTPTSQKPTAFGWNLSSKRPGSIPSFFRMPFVKNTRLLCSYNYFSNFNSLHFIYFFFNDNKSFQSRFAKVTGFLNLPAF